MSARFQCQYCELENVSTFNICKYCNRQQRGLPIRIPKNATKEQIDEYMKEFISRLNVSKKSEKQKDSKNGNSNRKKGISKQIRK